ncbi:glycosyltransferase [Candidatus Micrarchaeota archaeon]|nr:glycosyltransferase [Candidatus Micrarchaeota archaeon]
MNVLYIIAFFHPVKEGGAEIFAKELALNSIKEHEVSVLTGKYDNFLPSNEAYKGINIRRVPILMIKNLKLISFLFFGFLKGLFLKTDVYHGHMAFSAGTLAVLLGKLKGKPSIVTIQGGDMADYKENTGRFLFIMKPIISWTLRNASLVHAVSKDLKRKAMEFGVKEEKIKVIPNGVDSEKFRKRESGLKKKLGLEGRKIILSVSRLSYKNGMDLIISAFTNVKKRFNDSALVILGDGEERENLLNLVSKVNLKKDVVFLEPVPHERLSEYYSIADVFIRPSRDEGFGIVFIESMACSVPTIGTKVGGITDIIKDGETGLLIPAENTKVISEAIIKILSDSSFSKKLSENGRKEVERRFSWNSIAKEINTLYKNLKT